LFLFKSHFNGVVQPFRKQTPYLSAKKVLNVGWASQRCILG